MLNAAEAIGQYYVAVAGKMGRRYRLQARAGS
jgi:hypothetical protein